MMLSVNNLNKNSKEELLKTISGGRRPHAVLVDGGTEAEREEMAFLLAKIYVCEKAYETNEICDCCSSCRKADERIHPDIIKVAKPEDKKHFTKNSVKDVVENAFYTPNESRVKVYILSEMQLMAVESQNVLLKVLEEPPSYTAFVLTAESANSVIGTILSRVSRLRLGESGDDILFDEKTVAVTKKIIDAMRSPYEYDLISATSSLEGNKTLAADVLKMLSLFIRDALVIKNGGKVILKETEEKSSEIAYSFSSEKLLKMYEDVCSILRLTEGYPNYTLLISRLCTKLK